MVSARIASAALAATVTLTLGACGSDDSSTDNPTITSPAATSAAPGGSTATLSLVAKDNVFDPTSLTAASGVTVKLTVRNTGVGIHEFSSKDLGVGGQDVPAGKSVDISFTAPTAAGTYKFVCKYHEAIGMTGTLVVS